MSSYTAGSGDLPELSHVGEVVRPNQVEPNAAGGGFGRPPAELGPSVLVVAEAHQHMILGVAVHDIASYRQLSAAGRHRRDRSHRPAERTMRAPPPQLLE